MRVDGPDGPTTAVPGSATRQQPAAASNSATPSSGHSQPRQTTSIRHCSIDVAAQAIAARSNAGRSVERFSAAAGGADIAQGEVALAIERIEQRQKKRR